MLPAPAELLMLFLPPRHDCVTHWWLATNWISANTNTNKGTNTNQDTITYTNTDTNTKTPWHTKWHSCNLLFSKIDWPKYQRYARKACIFSIRVVSQFLLLFKLAIIWTFQVIPDTRIVLRWKPLFSRLLFMVQVRKLSALLAMHTYLKKKESFSHLFSIPDVQKSFSQSYHLITDTVKIFG